MYSFPPDATMASLQHSLAIACLVMDDPFLAASKSKDEPGNLVVPSSGNEQRVRRPPDDQRLECIDTSGSQNHHKGAGAVHKTMYCGLPIEHSWKDVIGNPMEQTVPNSCAPVALTVCLKAVHRMVYESIHGPGTFPFRAAAPEELLRRCSKERYRNGDKRKMQKVWDKGCKDIEKMMDVLVKMGGAPTTQGKRLPLKGWEAYYHSNGSLTPELAARLIYSRGPCVGVIFCTEEYEDIDASSKDKNINKVYRGCPRWMRRALVGLDDDGDQVGYHAVVCYAYRRRHNELQILILDNYSEDGPSRWISFREFDELFVLEVDPQLYASSTD